MRMFWEEVVVLQVSMRKAISVPSLTIHALRISI